MSKLFIVDEDGAHPELGEVTDELVFADNDDTLLIKAGQEATFEMRLPHVQLDRFLQAVLGITCTVLRIIRGEGHKRVAHLAKRAKKHRVQKKNVRRAFRILEKEG